MWFLVVSPLFVAALVMVIDLGYLWTARLELENSVAAAALAGAKTEWDGEQSASGSARRDAARSIAARFLAANTVAGVHLTTIASPTSPTDDRVKLQERVVLLGDVDLDEGEFDLTPSQVIDRGCHVKAAARLDSLCFGIPELYSLEAAATAVTDHQTDTTRLTRIESFES